MERPVYLIDTNAVIDYLSNKFPVSGMELMNNIIDAIPNISVITKIEVLGFNAPDEHYNTLSNFINDSQVMDLTNNIVETILKSAKNIKPNCLMPLLQLLHLKIT